MKIRAFIALKPPASWRAEFERIQNALKRELHGKGFRWVAPEQVHITLRFLGGILPEEAAVISKRLEALCREVKPFVLQMAGLGCFPSARRARVVWAGLRGGEDETQQLHAAVREQTAEFGEAPERRKFTPHLTLARVKEISREEAKALEAALRAPEEFAEPWNVAEMLLMRSHLGPGGSRYEMVSTHRLAA